MNNFEKTFNQMLDCVNTLQEDLNVSFGEALTETFDNLETGKIKVEDGAPTEEQVNKLSTLYRKLDYEHLPKRTKVMVFNYLTLKAINDDGRDTNQMPTPPAISTIIAILMQRLLPKENSILVDPTVGTGGLLYSVVNQLLAANHSKNNFKLVGIDNDEEMLNFADIAAHLNNLQIDLYCQDALANWMTKADTVIGDLPVGYYPLDNNAQNFELRNNKGHSYAHYLLVEQIVKNLNPGGYSFLVLPKNMMVGKEREIFMPWLTKKVYLRAIVDLPDELFKNKFNQKEIVVFQNHGAGAKSSDVFLTKLGSLKKEDSLVEFNVKLNEWYTNSSH